MVEEHEQRDLGGRRGVVGRDRQEGFETGPGRAQVVEARGAHHVQVVLVGLPLVPVYQRGVEQGRGVHAARGEALPLRGAEAGAGLHDPPRPPALRARAEGRFDTQISPIGGLTFDEGMREPNVDKIRSLPTLVPGGRITAALASQISDASAAMLICSAQALKDHNLTPRARIHHLSVRGSDPIIMLDAPIPATKYALAKAGMTIEDMDLIEINEAFASVVLAWQKATGADLSKVNVNGGAIALGHPLGATGVRLMTTLLNELERTGGRYGLQTMCEGGGQANVTIIERL